MRRIEVVEQPCESVLFSIDLREILGVFYKNYL